MIPSIKPLLQDMTRDGWALVRDFPPLDRDQFLAFCREAGKGETDPTLHWGFGPVMDLKVDETAKNYLFTHEAVPFHWDGVFFEVPSVLVFHCLEAPARGAGGQTLFTHAEKLYGAIPETTRHFWRNARVTYTTEKVAHYGGTTTVPLFGVHPHKGTPVVRFAERVTTAKNPVGMTISGVDAATAQAIELFLTNAMYDDRFCYAHEWKPGDLLLADNHALMHGRRAFTQNSPRHIRRIQLK